MGFYKKKPVTIEAEKWDSDDMVQCGRVAAWLQMGAADFRVNKEKGVDIRTLEGVMTASNGDWIIKGIKGEFYPCKPDIFEATYEEVKEAWGKIMSDPLKLTNQLWEVVEKSGESVVNCFLAAETVFIRCKDNYEKVPPQILTPEERAEIDASVAEMEALAKVNQAKIYDEALQHIKKEVV